jgi:ribosomal protein S18 acetylase RimI-like enzyme
MEILKITIENSRYLTDFLNNNISSYFRYYNKRDITVIKDHFLTCIGTIQDKPVAYGHIDYSKDENKYWLGICLLDEFQGKGYGKQMMNALIDIFNNSTHIDTLYLTVDKDNTKAISMYKKYLFSIIAEGESYYMMCLNKKE